MKSPEISDKFLEECQANIQKMMAESISRQNFYAELEYLEPKHGKELTKSQILDQLEQLIDFYDNKNSSPFGDAAMRMIEHILDRSGRG